MHKIVILAKKNEKFNGLFNKTAQINYDEYLLTKAFNLRPYEVFGNFMKGKYERENNKHFDGKDNEYVEKEEEEEEIEVGKRNVLMKSAR